MADSERPSVRKSRTGQSSGSDTKHPRHAAHGAHVAAPLTRKEERAQAKARREGTATPVGFGSKRRGRKANASYVENVIPQTQTGENASQYSRRTSQRGYIENIQRKKRTRLGFIIVGLICLVAAVAIGIGAITFYVTADNRLALGESNAKEALVTPAPDEPYYILAAANLAVQGLPNGIQDDAYLVVRVDEGQRLLTFVAVPSSLRTRMSDGDTHSLAEAASVGGDAELIKAVSDLTGFSIAHFVDSSADAIASAVNQLGGVELEVLEEVDDPRAGTYSLAAGRQSLDGAQALTYLRAYNFAQQLELQAQDQVNFLMQFSEQALNSQGHNATTTVGAYAEYLQTDMSTSDLVALADALMPLDELTIYWAIMPGHLVESDDSDSYSLSSSEWEAMRTRVEEGQDPAGGDDSLGGSLAAGTTVEVRNGTSIDGAAAQMAAILESLGYTVTGTGNTDDDVTYPETLVIYKDPAFETTAQAIVSDSGSGRVVNGGDYYTFSSNVLVIIGADWMPVL